MIILLLWLNFVLRKQFSFHTAHEINKQTMQENKQLHLIIDNIFDFILSQSQIFFIIEIINFDINDRV